MNSPLVEYTLISPNQSGKRKRKIKRITPHCVVGQVTIESLANMFATPTRQASSNYGIDKDGRVGMFVEEDCASWCSSSTENDQQAVTIECASDMAAPYAFRQEVYEKLIELCIDICKRNGAKKLLWLEDKNTTLKYKPADDEMVLTVHRWFKNKSCPGDWMFERMGELAEKVTDALSGTVKEPAKPNNLVPAEEAKTIKKEEPVVEKTDGFEPYTIKVNVPALNRRSAPSTDSIVLGILTNDGVPYTIVEESDGPGASKWGKLKAAGAGWISLDFCVKA